MTIRMESVWMYPYHPSVFPTILITLLFFLVWKCYVGLAFHKTPWVYEPWCWFSPPLHSLSCKCFFYLYIIPAVKNHACFFCLWLDVPWICPFCCARELCSKIIPHKELPLTMWGFAGILPLLLLLTSWSCRWRGVILFMTPVGYQSLEMPCSRSLRMRRGTKPWKGRVTYPWL